MTAVDAGAAPATWIPEIPAAPRPSVDRDARGAAASATVAAIRRATPALERRRLWERRFRIRLIVTDAAIIATATVSASVLHLLAAAPRVLVEDPWVLTRLPLGATVTWLAMLWAFQTRAPRVIGGVDKGLWRNGP